MCLVCRADVAGRSRLCETHEMFLRWHIELGGGTPQTNEAMIRVIRHLEDMVHRRGVEGCRRDYWAAS